MKSTTNPGLNRTGLAASPLDAEKMLEVTAMTQPSADGDAEDTLAPRKLYAKEAPAPHGTVPPPASLKEAATTLIKGLTGQKATVLVDKLGERLAFERAGVRLYEGLIAKFDVFGTWEGGPSREDLERIHADEHRHFMLVKSIIERLGSDPTTVTPSANVHAVASMGIVKVISDPRMNLKECIEAIAVAELTDNDCWANLVELLRASGHEELAEEAEDALLQEREHLSMVRDWIATSLATSAALPIVRSKVKSELQNARRSPPNMAAKKKATAKASPTRRKTVVSRAKAPPPSAAKSKTARRTGASAKIGRSKRR